jgi:hypothetical protein
MREGREREDEGERNKRRGSERERKGERKGERVRGGEEGR